MKKILPLIVLPMLIFTACTTPVGTVEDMENRNKKTLVAEEWFKKGYVANDLDEKIKYYQKAIAISPNYIEVLVNLGDVYHYKGMLDEAIAQYKKVITINPDDAVAHTILAFFYNEKGMIDEAIAEFKKTIDINPNNALAHNNLGVMYKKRGMFDEALAQYKKALKIDPKCANAHYNLGMIYGIKGPFPLAADHLHKAGLFYLEQGDKEMALESYEFLKRTKSKELVKDLHEKLHPEPMEEKSKPSE